MLTRAYKTNALIKNATRIHGLARHNGNNYFGRPRQSGCGACGQIWFEVSVAIYAELKSLRGTNLQTPLGVYSHRPNVRDENTSSNTEAVHSIKPNETIVPRGER